jgi:hypothetical protein
MRHPLAQTPVEWTQYRDIPSDRQLLQVERTVSDLFMTDMVTRLLAQSVARLERRVPAHGCAIRRALEVALMQRMMHSPTQDKMVPLPSRHDNLKEWPKIHLPATPFMVLRQLS